MANESGRILDRELDPYDEWELDHRALVWRTVATEAEPPLETIGQALRRARQRAGRRLRDVSFVLKIPSHQLIAIENACFEVLPGRTYAIGHVRSYAAYLGLDAEQIVERLKAEIDGRAGATDHIAAIPPAERTLPYSSIVISALLVAAFVCLLAAGERAVEPPIIPVPGKLVAEARLGKTAAAEQPRLPVQLRAPIVVAESLQVPSEVAVTSPAPPPVVAPIEPAPRLQVQLPAGKRYGTRNRNSRITLRVHRPTHIAVQGMGNRIFIDRVLRPGDTYRVPNRVGLRLNSRNAGAVELILDGVSMGFVGQNGSAARGLSLNPQSIVDRQRG